MAVSFASASSQYLANSAAPVTAVPFTVGMWIRDTTSASDEVFWSLTDTAAADDGWSLFKGTDNGIRLGCYRGATYAEAVGPTLVSGQWTFVLGRMISATNRRLAVLQPTGVTSAQSTTSCTPTGIDSIGIGCELQSSAINFFNGSVAEYWMANIDVHRGGGAIPNTYMYQLAYGGPFSVPFIERNLVDYRSFRQSITSDQDHGQDYYLGGQRPVRQVWTNVNGATLGPHPPLPGYYERWNTQQMPVLV